MPIAIISAFIAFVLAVIASGLFVDPGPINVSHAVIASAWLICLSLAGVASEIRQTRAAAPERKL